ncbi:MAG: hypothetical protein B7733_10440 [Myxococcales bacterium FL481]|nr:MAG: hypothetical protein B7733_10440 [Myxococcales bacterium FL481]
MLLGRADSIELLAVVDLAGGALTIPVQAPVAKPVVVADLASPGNRASGAWPRSAGLLFRLRRFSARGEQVEVAMVDAASLAAVWRRLARRIGVPNHSFELVEIRLEPTDGNPVEIHITEHALPAGPNDPTMPGPPLARQFRRGNDGVYVELTTRTP